jgi:hypothetical protein
VIAAGVRVLMTVRGDFLTYLAALLGLGEELSRALYLLRPLSPAAMREAIVGPARRKGVTFESEALLDDLVGSGARAPGGLPLLQFAMEELWEARDRALNRIPAAASGERWPATPTGCSRACRPSNAARPAPSCFAW